MAWTDDQRAEAIAAYEAAEPTQENSQDIVSDIAESMDQSINGVRAILSKAGVYIAKGKSPSKAKSGGSARVSKADAYEKLFAAIESVGGEIDESIITKLTGKAALYLAGIITKVND